MSTLHFTSDLHFGHEKVAALRGFASAAEHDAAVMEIWASVVTSRDKVYVLGDFTGDSRALVDAIDRLAHLPGEKHLISGNHDACHPRNRRAHIALPKYLGAFASVASAGVVKIAGEDVLMSHFPYTRDRDVTRYPQWRLPDLGAWLLHGHTHGTERATITPPSPGTEHLFGPSREIHVGLDAWHLTPVSLDTITALIKEHS